MDNSTNSNERKSNHIEIRTVSPVDESTKRMIVDFLSEQFSAAMVGAPTFDEAKKSAEAKQIFMERKNYTTVLGNAKQVIDDLLTHCDKARSFVDFAMENGKVAGICITGITKENQVLSEFVGVGWNYQKQGIGTKLVEHRHKIISSPPYNISQYEVKLAVDSKRIFEKTGIDLQPVAGELKTFIAKIKRN